MPKVSQASKKLSSAQSAYIGSSKGIAESELNIKDIEDRLALDVSDLGKKQFAASLVLSSLDALGIGDALEGQEIIQEEAAREAYGDYSKAPGYKKYIEEIDPTGEGDLSTDISQADPYMKEQFEQAGGVDNYGSNVLSYDQFKETDAYSKYLEGFKATPTKQGLFGKYGPTSWFSPKKYGDKEFTYKQARKTGKLFGEGKMFGDQELFSLLENRMTAPMYPSLDAVSGGQLNNTFAKRIQETLGSGDWSDLNKLWKEKGYDKKFGIDYTTFTTRYNK
jgi:hypothetical protein